ncbi:uncharacterized protein LOC111699610 [Eurytemora carolleeae]|uniref:uncharacterized protein LOC111699610 n=1 Tax=Eurytemora carolleeae TaxID=1294199 RepID=UPI000C759C97|nr:uncharacterized protein LOC111699610 [Eurytemora carolleeae]|eukprot:XP_023326089.1 uncharacterized protein LOC111699610 [Eurytemora affinis]
MESWNEEWRSMPWKHWTSPVERFQVLPSFVLGEFVFIFLTLVTLVHAARHGRKYVAVWLAAFLAGTANDAIFMMLPMVDNFWQAQACIMLTPRMPLYIPCVYNIFMYCGFVAADMLQLSLVPGACLAGILGEAIYSPYDITGAKFLWWTWHDTDAPIRNKLLGVPIGSSVWVITFTCSFYFILSMTLFRKKMSTGLSLLLTSLFSTPLMVLQMSVLQLIAGEAQGLPTYRSLVLVLILYLSLIVVGYIYRDQAKPSRFKDANYTLLFFLVGYYTFMTANMGLGNPESHISSGVHQEYGDCNITAPDITGHLRQVYLCRETHVQDFSFDCEDVCGKVGVDCSEASTSWYTVCGRRHSNYSLYLLATSIISTLGCVFYTFTLTYRGSTKQKKN